MAYRIIENSVNGISDITEFLCDTAEDVSYLPEEAGMGSIAQVLDNNGDGFAVYKKNSEGKWTELK